ncbi:MAG: DUF937 domain-containing protein [Hyphomicrobiales bacterium]|nr:DUF937 domain-containing protein [Hyphomicrobiales bacterium]
MDLFDIMQQAGGGKAFEAMAGQYGLQPDQVQSAMEAFMPAFATGLQRNTADPTGFLKFMQAISTGRHANYYDNPQSALSGLGIEEGNAILGHLFGSKDVSRAVADQVNAATGIGQSILKQMLPVIASMVLGGLFKQSRGGANPILETIIEQMTGGGAPAKGPLDRYEDEEAERESREASPAPGGFGDNPFGKMMEDMLGGGAVGSNPWGRMMEEMMGSPKAGQERSQKPAATPQTPQSGPQSGKDIFGDMLEPGRRMGEAYQKNMESIFDQFLRGMDQQR